MGSRISKQPSGIEELFQYVREGTFKNYGEVKLMRSKATGEIHAIKQILPGNEEAFRRAKLRASRRMLLDCVSLAKFGAVIPLEYSEYCNTMYKIYTAHEYLDLDLSMEIAARYDKRMKFAEGEMFYIIKSVVRALKVLKSFKMETGEPSPVYHEDLASRTILVANPSGEIKILDNKYVTGLSAYKQFIYGSSEYCYLSPELFLAFGKRTQKITHDDKSEIFALGVVCIEAMGLQHPESIYNYNEFTLNTQEIDNLLNRQKDRYSPKLINLIRSMLIIDKDARWGYQQILDYIKPYKGELKRIEIYSAKKKTALEAPSPINFKESEVRFFLLRKF
jgi:serine/threonine protein kinase